MPIVGVICGYDGTKQAFDTCINCHESFAERNCHAPVELLRSMKNNMASRGNAGWSASTLLSCPRAVALLESNDYYEPLKTGWNKSRGTWTHLMMESEMVPDKNILAEVRLERYYKINGECVRITGKPDKVYKKEGIIMDYKSKYRLPTKPDPMHEAQMNVYAWLLRDGTIIDGPDKGKKVRIGIKRGGMLYVTWNTEPNGQFLKMGYPIWDETQMDQFLTDRIGPLAEWKRTGVLPACNPYHKGYWQCDCVKIEDQIRGRDDEESL